MKTLQDYITRYTNIASRLGYVGESVEVLVQLLANATYISEVENAGYVQESSIDKAVLMNSKIQHCVDSMYSVFRGNCPRIYMKIKPTKYFKFKPYDTIIESSNFNVYYLGYWGKINQVIPESTTGDTIIIDQSNYEITPQTDNNSVEMNDAEYDWIYSDLILPPSQSDEDIQIIQCFLAPKATGIETTINQSINYTNTYYVECITPNLSDDMYIEIWPDRENEETIVKTRLPRTRIFANHILDHDIFDLTLPSFGSRLYLADYFNTTVSRDSNNIQGMTTSYNVFAQYFLLSKLDDYNESELNRLNLEGAELIDFEETEFIGLDRSAKGLIYIDAIPRDDIGTIHYKANRDRYVSSIVRSNSDLGIVLEEQFPNFIAPGGTSYKFKSTDTGNSVLTIYYIPKDPGKLLTETEKQKFLENRKAYYIVTNDIYIEPGDQYSANFNISVELFNQDSGIDWKQEIGENILRTQYENKFGINLSNELKNIESLISKYSNIKKVSSINVTVTGNDNQVVDLKNISTDHAYFKISYQITSSVVV